MVARMNLPWLYEGVMTLKSGVDDILSGIELAARLLFTKLSHLKLTELLCHCG